MANNTEPKRATRATPTRRTILRIVRAACAFALIAGTFATLGGCAVAVKGPRARARVAVRPAKVVVAPRPAVVVKPRPAVVVKPRCTTVKARVVVR